MTAATRGRGCPLSLVMLRKQEELRMQDHSYADDQRQDVTHLFDQLRSAAATMHTTDEHEAAEQQAQGTIRLIDVHIYDLPAEEQDPSIESTLADPITDPDQQSTQRKAPEEEPST